MEHPIFFIDAILSAMGFEHFAHHYSHVTYTWFTMLILILSALFLAKKVKLVPEGGQNFFEVLISGLENFMVEITGPEGRFFFPFIATVFLFVLVSNLIGLIPGFLFPHGQSEYHPGPGPLHLYLHPHHRHQISRRQIHQTFLRPGLVAHPPHVSH
jgi:F0F1-type ATP synthase membrane subunit a